MEGVRACTKILGRATLITHYYILFLSHAWVLKVKIWGPMDSPEATSPIPHKHNVRKIW